MNTSWEGQEGTLIKTFHFADFKEALLFVVEVGKIAELQMHHPDILLHNYREVRITTTTHSEGSTITSKDYELAHAIDTLLHL